MALRFRTRLTFTVSALTLFIVTTMTLAAAILVALALWGQMWQTGEFVTQIADQNISYGVRLSDRVEERIEEQMQITAMLSAEVADLSTRRSSITTEHIAEIYQKVLGEARTAEGHRIVGQIEIEGPRGSALLGDDSEAPGEISVASRAGDYEVRMGTSAALESQILSDFELQGFIERMMVDQNFVRMAVIDRDGQVVAAVDSEGRRGEQVVDADLGESAVEYLRQFQELDTIPEDAQPGFVRVGNDIGVLTPLLPSGTAATYALFIQHNATEGIRFIANRMLALVTLGALMVLIGLAVSVLLSRSLSKPIVQLTHQVREFGKGNLNHRLTWKRKDEFRDLAETFNIMAISLQEYMHELERETSQRERLESELRIASQMQTTLLPEAPPEVKQIEIAAMSQPSREVGGDFYDYLEPAPGCVGLVVGDATGKGLSAAMLITQCASVLRTLSRDIRDPGQLLCRTNNEFFHQIGATHNFVTLFMIVVDTDRGVARYAAAGHPPPMVVNSKSGKAKWLEGSSSYPLGIVEDAEFHVAEIALEPGDTIVMYSDGLTEAQNANNDLYGPERISAVLAESGDRDPEAILAALRDSALEYMGGQEASDDMTIVVARFLGVAADRSDPASESPVQAQT